MNAPPSTRAGATAPTATSLLDHPFDHYQRFQPVKEILAAYRAHRGGTAPLTVLDIGGGDGHLGHFLDGDRVLVVDLGRIATPHVYARGEALPFADAAFDVVTSIDALEHVPAGLRTAFLQEASRVSRGLVVVAAPFDAPGVAAAEGFVERIHQEIYGRRDEWLLEHAANGLPELEAALEALRPALPEVRVAPNGYLPYWRLTMAINHLLLAIPESFEIYRSINRVVNQEHYRTSHREPAYRKLVVATRGDASWLDGALAAISGPPAGGSSPPAIDGLEAEILGILGRGLVASVQQKLDLVKDLEDHTARQEQEIEDLGRQVGKVEGYVEHLRREHDALQAEYEHALSHVAELQTYVHQMEAEFARVDQLVNEWGVRRELAEQHATRLEARLSQLQDELQQREGQLQELAERWSVRRTLRRLTGPVS